MYLHDGAMMATDKTPPWKRKRPKGPATRLTKAEIAEAKALAKKAGRRYPNLVDNMAIAAKKRAQKPE